MPETFEPKFVDLVRQHTRIIGTGNFLLDSVPVGFAGFAEALSIGDQFYYSAFGIDKPHETEVGRGRLEADGSISREPLNGLPTAFSGGTTVVSLVVGASWFEDGGFHKNIVATSAVSRPVRKKLSEVISVTDFGAKGDGVTDDTDAFNAALAALGAARISPPGLSGWGMGRILVPRGNYRIDGTIQVSSPIGVCFVGDGQYASTIVRSGDAGTVFSLKTYIAVSFEHLAFVHEATGEQDSWTNILFDLDGTSGGRSFKLGNCSTHGFGTVIRYNQLVNEDRTFAIDCYFKDFHTFLDGVNSQAVCNSFLQCSWMGTTKRGFYVAGHGNTLIETACVAMDGPLIEFRNVASRYNRNGFTLVNAKFEWTAADKVAGNPAKIMTGDAVHAIGNVSMRDCSVYGGPVPHADACWGKIGFGGVNIDIQGGRLDGKLEVVKYTTLRPEKAAHVKLTGVQISDPADWIYSGTTSGAVYPPISLSDCQVTGQNAVSLTMTRGEGAPHLDPARTIVLANHATALPAWYSGVTQINHPFHGENVHLREIKWVVRSAAASAQPRVITLYGDAARTQLLATLSLPTSAMNNAILSFILPNDDVVVDGLHLDVDCPAGSPTMRGFAIADIVSI